MKRAFVPPRAAPQAVPKKSKVSQPDENQPVAGAASAPLPTKRKFQAPGSSGSVPLTAVAQKMPCGPASAACVPVAKPDVAPGSAITAQYYTVLYTKRAANKVPCGPIQRFASLPGASC